MVDKEPNPCCVRYQEGDRSGKPQPDLRRRGAETPLVFERSRGAVLWTSFVVISFTSLLLFPSSVSPFTLESATPSSAHLPPKRSLLREVPVVGQGDHSNDRPQHGGKYEVEGHSGHPLLAIME